ASSVATRDLIGLRPYRSVGQHHEVADTIFFGAFLRPESNRAGTAGDSGAKSLRLRAPVSLGDCAISQRTVMKNAG
ncbi:MAG TPA: hypothetical protein VLL06_06195, partial [Nitrospiraceae bacterium]|nr:hypothetical protein [Nitrospiraceae bacterium]